jgi:phage I-like protein
MIDLSRLALGERTRIPIAVLGKYVKDKRQFSITKDDLAVLVENFRKRKTGETVIDYEHASEWPEVAAGQPVPAAGWLQEMDDAPDAKGILWGLTEFTARALDMIAKKEYRYLSPVIAWGARDKTSGEQQGVTLTSMALTNRPFLEAMPAIQLSEAWVADTEPAEQVTERRKENMPVKKVVLADRAAGTVRVIAEDNTESVLTVEGFPAEQKVVQLSDVKRDKDGRMDFASLPHADLIAGEVVAAMASQTALDAAIQAGKILPAQRKHYEVLALSDLAGFDELVKGMKPQVELNKERGVAGPGEEENGLKLAEARIEQLIGEKRKLQPELRYGAALRLVASENPELWRRRQELQDQKLTGREA